MNDNTRRGPEWKRLVAEYFIPRYGRTIEQWHQANEIALNWLINRMRGRELLPEQRLPAGYHEEEDQAWITIMFDHLDLQIPENPVELSQIAREWITERVDSSYPGIVNTIHQLANHYTLYTASNEVSFELRGYLAGMGVVHHFSEYFGSDILGAFKTSPYYFEQLIKHTGIDPSNAVVVDDSLTNLKHAASIGFLTIHSGLSGASPGPYPFFTDPQQLPQLILSLS